MKKTLYLLFFLITTCAYSQVKPNQDDPERANRIGSASSAVKIAAAEDVCNGSSITTVFNQDNGQRGQMFDLVATKTLTVKYIDTALYVETSSTYEIWYRPGSFNGFENNGEGWTLVGQATNVTSNGDGVPTRIPILVNVTIPAGQTYGFYVTNTEGGGVNYTNGGAIGDVLASDTNLSLRQGVGKRYPFGSTFDPRKFNGSVCYELNCTTLNVSSFTNNTPEGLAVQVSGGVSYERFKNIDRINGYEIRQTEQNQTGYFLITQPGPYLITVIGANGCRATVSGIF